MPKFEVKLGTEYLAKLRELEENTYTICEDALYEGAGVIADEMRKNANKVLSKEATGQMMASMGIADVDIDPHGVINTKVWFDGYDNRETPNELKANTLESGRVIPKGHNPKKKNENRIHMSRAGIKANIDKFSAKNDPKSQEKADRYRKTLIAIESGTSTQPKRPFVRPAVKAKKAEALKIIEESIDKKIKKIME